MSNVIHNSNYLSEHFLENPHGIEWTARTLHRRNGFNDGNYAFRAIVTLDARRSVNHIGGLPGQTMKFVYRATACRQPCNPFRRSYSSFSNSFVNEYKVLITRNILKWAKTLVCVCVNRLIHLSIRFSLTFTSTRCE